MSRDGIVPADLRRVGREQLQPYDSVVFRFGEAVDAQQTERGFAVVLDDGTMVHTRRLLLATGVRDELPAIEGFAECWGKTVLHCPYCHGWEVRDQPLTLYGNAAIGMELAQLLRGWSRDLVLCTDGAVELTVDEQQQLIRHDIGIREEKIVRLECTNGVLHRIIFATGEPLPRHALFLRPVQRQRSTLPAQLGCAFVGQGPLPDLVKVDPLGETSVPGLYVAGDAMTAMQQAIVAAASGVVAAGAINRALLQEEFN
ncbi:MAG: NAD(P)/FAD-dependent oxidoreductase [Chloroflexales bacterium]|nr:NAD(P)/FAD-dependent oxidoreductase [Chloroflexales bacterium]